MKLYKTLLASALCAALIPAQAGGVLLDFNNVPAGANSFHVLDTYASQGFHFADAAFVVRSNKSGNSSGGGFYTPYPSGGSNSNIGALTLSADPPPANGQPSSFTVLVDQGFSGYFKALAGVVQRSDVSIEAFDKDGHSLAQETLTVSDSTSGCDSQWVCNWSALNLELGSAMAYSVTVTGMESLAWFDNFEFGATADSGGGGNEVPEPASLMLAAAALSALAWARRRNAS